MPSDDKPTGSRVLPGLGGTRPAPLHDAAQDTVNLQSASAQVANTLRREIQRGDHPPRARLRQRDVAERLGVSTTPVREAFQVLHAEGFLVVENHRGAVVVQPSEADIREGYAIRVSLEGLAVRHAAESFDADAEPGLRELLAHMRATTVKDRWAALDDDFHRRLYAMAAMPRLQGLIDGLRGGVAFYIESAFEDPKQRADADADHVALLDACARGDAAAAERAVQAHLEKTARVVTRAVAEHDAVPARA